MEDRKTEEERLLSDYQGLRLLQKRKRSGEMDTTCIQSSPDPSYSYNRQKQRVFVHMHQLIPIFFRDNQPKTSVHSCSRWIRKYFSQSEYSHNKNADEDCRWTITESLSRLFYPSGPSKHEILINAAHSWENLILRSSCWRILLARIDYMTHYLYDCPWPIISGWRRQQNSG